MPCSRIRTACKTSIDENCKAHFVPSYYHKYFEMSPMLLNNKSHAIHCCSDNLLFLLNFLECCIVIIIIQTFKKVISNVAYQFSQISHHCTLRSLYKTLIKLATTIQLVQHLVSISFLQLSTNIHPYTRSATAHCAALPSPLS